MFVSFSSFIFHLKLLLLLLAALWLLLKFLAMLFEI